MSSIFLKTIFKKTIPYFPGYHCLCLFLRQLKPRAWQWVNRIPVKPGMVVLVHSKVGDFYMSHPQRCSIAKKFFWTHGIRELLQDRITLELFSDLSKHSDVILDIGANSGLFSLVAAKANPNAHIIAFDILPEAYHILTDNLMLNDLFDKVEIRLMGLGGKREAFYAPFGHMTSEMPTALSLDSKMTDTTKIRVPIKTFDEICYPRFVGKRLCAKIDVEGTEADIFTNGRQTLQKIKPDIICEVLANSKQVNIYDQILKEYSYRRFLITNEGLKEFDQINPDHRYKDWFFTTKSDLGVEIKQFLSA